MKITNKDKETIDRLFELSIKTGKGTVARIFRALGFSFKYIILAIIAILMIVVGFFYGSTKIRSKDYYEDEFLGI